MANAIFRPTSVSDGAATIVVTGSGLTTRETGSAATENPFRSATVTITEKFPVADGVQDRTVASAVAHPGGSPENEYDKAP